MSEPLKESPDVCGVKVDVVSEVGADVGVRVHHGAVQRRPAYADHHGDQTQQQQDKTRIASYLI